MRSYGLIGAVNEILEIEIKPDYIENNLVDVDVGMETIKFIQIIDGLKETFSCEIPDSKLLITVQKIFDVLTELQKSRTYCLNEVII